MRLGCASRRRAVHRGEVGRHRVVMTGDRRNRRRTRRLELGPCRDRPGRIIGVLRQCLVARGLSRGLALSQAQLHSHLLKLRPAGRLIVRASTVRGGKRCRRLENPAVALIACRRVLQVSRIRHVRRCRTADVIRDADRRVRGVLVREVLRVDRRPRLRHARSPRGRRRGWKDRCEDGQRRQRQAGRRNDRDQPSHRDPSRGTRAEPVTCGDMRHQPEPRVSTPGSRVSAVHRYEFQSERAAC